MECNNCHFKNTDGARFCSQCGTALNVETAAPLAQESGYAERRQLTVLFSDLVGSTSLSEQLDPEDLRAIMRDYQSACTSVIGLFDGYVAKYLGDGVLAYFGYPTAHEDDARRAIEAGLGIVEAMKSINERYANEIGVPLEVRVGIHTGLVVVGDMDSTNTLEANAITGQTPNFAARIQSAADPNTVLVSAETNKLTKGYFESVDLGSYELKGFSQAVKLFRIDHASTARSRLDAALGKLTPFSGRKSEISELHESWHRAQAGDGQIVLLGGEAGVGKSRIVLSIKEYASHDTDSWLTELRCSPFHLNSSFYPIIDFLERIALRFERDETPAEKLTKIEGFVAQYGFEANEAVPLLAALMSVPFMPAYAPLAITPQRQKQMTVDLLNSILLHRADRQPVLFVLEDLHWADPSTLEMLGQLINQCATHKILALLTYRPEFVPTWPAQPNLHQIELRGLPTAEGAEIVRRTANNKTLPPEVLEYITAKTDGIPLFLEELTKSVLESDALIDRGDHYELSGPFHTLGVPTTIQDSLTARLDRLPEAKPVAQLASAIGREFSFEMLESIPGNHQREMRDNLDRLVSAGILYQRGLAPKATYTFKHALIQDSAYSSLLKTSRRDYHKLIAEAIETHSPQLVETQPELLAQHYAQAGMSEKAVGYWLMAGVRALQRSANSEALSHLRQGLALTPKIADEATRNAMELQLHSMVGPALIAMKGFGDDEVGQAYDKAGRISSQMGRGIHLFIPLWGQAQYHLIRDDLAKSFALCEELLRLSSEANDEALQVISYAFLGNSNFWMGNFDKSFEMVNKALSLYDMEKHRAQAYIFGQDSAVTAHSYRMLSSWYLGDTTTSADSIAEAHRIAAAMQHPFSICWAHNFAMTVHSLNEDYAATIAEADKLIQISQEQAYPFWIPAALVQKGWALAHTQTPEAGIPLIEQGIAIWNQIGTIIVTPLFLGWQAEVLGLAGEYEKAIASVDLGISQAHRCGELASEIDLHRIKGELLRKIGNVKEAEASLRHGLELARSRNARSRELQAATSLYALLRGTDAEQSAHTDALAVLAALADATETPFITNARSVLQSA